MKKETEIFLNCLKELYNGDKHAVDCLFSIRIPFKGNNEIYAKEIIIDENSSARIGILGILNYILERLNGDKISATLNEDDILVDFNSITKENNV